MADNWAAGINGAEDDDEALRIAIALSLGEDPARGERAGGRGVPVPGVVDLTQEEDGGAGDGNGDGDGGGVVAVDGGDGGRSGIARPSRELQEPAAAPEQQQPSSASASASAFSALGLDRKKMEEERLARLNKRKASTLEDVQQPARATQRPRIADASSQSNTVAPPEKHKSAGSKAAISSSTSQQPAPRIAGPPPTSAPAKEEAAAARIAAPNSTSSSSSNRLPFPQGVVKKTWAFGQPRKGDDIKLEEVLQKQHLQMAVLSSYQWDEEFLLTKIDIARTKLILIAFAADDTQKDEMRANVPRDRIRFCFPPMLGALGMGSMHSKLMLLKYEKYMRIVVPTGNLMSYDWGETGTMENMVFLIDLPKFQTAEEKEAQKLTPFAEELFYFLRAQELDEKLVASLRNYDFAETARYHFVHTIPGSHAVEDAWRRTGYCGLGQAVSSLGLSSLEPIELDFVTTSIGAANYGLAMALYNACQGDSGLKEYESRTSTGKTKQNASVGKVVSTVKAHMRIFYPSKQTVLQSKGGEDGAGTICFQPKWWKASTFPHELMRDCKSVRPGMLMHCKVMYIRPHDASSSLSSAARCFAYVGSANLSESAWGRLVRDRGSGKPKMTCRNWECGVLIRARDVEDQGPAEGGGSSGGDLRVFEGRVPVPMEWPGREYASSGDAGAGAAAAAATPWFRPE